MLLKMLSFAKLKNVFRGTNVLQIILCVILFHSLASILIIYIHLMWFFSEEKLWKRPDEDIQIKKNSIVWNIHSTLNVLTSRIISSDEISTFGWWMDHVRFETDIRCFNQRFALCSRGFSTTCKADGIRAIYQYVTFSKDSVVNGFDLSVTATADQLESQAIGASFGVLAVVKLHDGRAENVQIHFPSNIEPLTSRSVSFSAGRSFVFSITVMLMCFGYSGSVHFTDPVLIPHASFLQGPMSYHPHCPLQLEKPHVANDIIKLEELQKPANKSIKDEHNLVTLVTQVSMERLSALERSLRLWYGPVSLVIYVAEKHSEKSGYGWQRFINWTS